MGQKKAFILTKDEKTPTGETAVLNPMDPKIEKALHTERAMEGYKKLIDSLTTGSDFSPIVIARVDGEIKATSCDLQNGVYVLPEFKPPSKLQLFLKKRLVQKIIKTLNPILRRDIGNIVQVALLRKTDIQLKEIQKKMDKGDPPKLTNRIGCIYLEVGDESTQI